MTRTRTNTSLGPAQERVGPAESALRLVVQLTIAVVLLTPVALAIVTALQPATVSLTGRPTLAFVPTLENFFNLFGAFELGRPLLNSALSSGIAMVVALLIGLPAAYALSRVRVRGSLGITTALFVARGLPAIGVAIPLYTFFAGVGLVDTIWALVIVYLPFNIALVVWLMQSYFDSVPVELDEAASIDGASRLTTLLRIVLPVSGPGVVSTALLTFMYGWNNFFYPLVFTNREAVTIPVALTQFLGDYSVNWGGLMAGVVLLSAPMVLLGYLLRRYMVSGLTSGSVK